jgi:aminobenzoyl-glutamate transport protein
MKMFNISGPLAEVLDGIERWGNKLPHPFNLFLFFSLAVLLLSWIAHALGLSVAHPLTGKPIVSVNLLDRQGIQNIITKAVSNFTGFAPLGTVLVAMIGVGVAERSGLFSAALKGFVRSVPAWLITAALVFAGVNASLTVDAGYVILVPLGAVLFAQVGRHPIAGLAAAFAGVSGGFSANLFLTPVDPLLAGLTQEAARLYDKSYVVPSDCQLLFHARIDVFADSHRRGGKQLDYRASIGGVSRAGGTRVEVAHARRTTRLDSRRFHCPCGGHCVAGLDCSG